MEYGSPALTIIESRLFSKLWPDYWSEEERGEFAAFIANSPEAGPVIPAHILRKIAEELGHATS